MFINNCIIDRYTDKNKNRQCITSYIKHLAVSGLSKVLARVKGACNLTGKCFEMPNVSYTRPVSSNIKKMILIPYSKVIMRSDFSSEKIKNIISEKYAIQINEEEDNVEEKNNSTDNEEFEIIRKASGKDIWSIKLKGKLKKENKSTIIETHISLYYTTWIHITTFLLITSSISAGIYLVSRITNELNSGFWSLQYFNLLLYIGTLIIFQIKKYRLSKSLMIDFHAIKQDE